VVTVAPPPPAGLPHGRAAGQTVGVFTLAAIAEISLRGPVRRAIDDLAFTAGRHLGWVEGGAAVASVVLAALFARWLFRRDNTP
jgi:hypothetical protein